MSRESNPTAFFVVRYDERAGTYELGKYVSGPGVALLREVLEQLNKVVQLEMKESA